MAATKSVEPCVRCRHPSGWARRPGGKPFRGDGRRYGYDGGLCRTCHNHCWRQFVKANPEWHGVVEEPAPDSEPTLEELAEVAAMTLEVRAQSMAEKRASYPLPLPLPAPVPEFPAIEDALARFDQAERSMAEIREWSLSGRIGCPKKNTISVLKPDTDSGRL